MDKRSLAPYAWMVCGCFVFAWMGEFAHLLGRTCDWRIVALARSFLAFSFAASIATASGRKLVFWNPPILWMRSLTGSVSLLCTFFALTRLPTAEVLTLTNTFPIWVAILSWPLLQQRPNLATWVAACCGVGGIVLIQHPSAGTGFTAQLAVPLALVASFSSAVAMLGLNRLQGLDPWAIVTHFSGVATVVVLATWLIGAFPDLEPLANPRTLVLLLGVGATATAGQWCLTHAFTMGQPARVSIVGLTQVVFALGLDLLFGTARMEALTLAGIGLVLAPTAWMMAGRAED